MVRQPNGIWKTVVDKAAMNRVGQRYETNIPEHINDVIVKYSDKKSVKYIP